MVVAQIALKGKFAFNRRDNLVPRVSRARRDPGRVWSHAFVTIENTREGSSLNKEFVAFVALIHGVVKFLHTQPRLRRAILQWPS